LPPEGLGDAPDALGPACDIYSLGVILYEALTGRLPFEGSVHGILRQVLTEAPKPPSVFRAGLDPRLEAVCLRAMAKQPEERFAWMEAFAAALEGYPTGPEVAPGVHPKAITLSESSRATATALPTRTVNKDTSSPRRWLTPQNIVMALACLVALALGVALVL